jgi:hypothetical protein
MSVPTTTGQHYPPLGAAAARLDDLTDVNAGTPADGDVLTWDDGTQFWIAAAPLAKVAGLPFVIDGGGAVIGTGVKGDLEVPFAGTITQWTLLADQSGSITIDTWKDTYANFPPTVADTMWGTKPALSSQEKNQATGLSIAVAAGDIIRYNVDSATTITRATLAFTISRS